MGWNKVVKYSTCRKAGHDLTQPDSRAKDGRCKICKGDKDKRYIAKDINRLEKRKQRSKEWRNNNPEQSKIMIRNATLISRFGISLEEYTALLEKQGGVCALCGQLERMKGKKNLSVDHNHKTGKIRALLCHRCNAALGYASDDADLLRRMADYVEKDGIKTQS